MLPTYNIMRERGTMLRVLLRRTIPKVCGRFEQNSHGSRCPRQVPMVAPVRRSRSRLLPMKGSVAPAKEGMEHYSMDSLRLGLPHSMTCGDLSWLCHLQDSGPPLPAGLLACWTPLAVLLRRGSWPPPTALCSKAPTTSGPLCSLDLYCLAHHAPPLGTSSPTSAPPPTLPVAPSQEAAASPPVYVASTCWHRAWC